MSKRAREHSLTKPVLLGAALLAATTAAGCVGSSDSNALRSELRIQVASSSDDAEEKASGTVRLTSNDLELVADDTVQVVGVRFDQVAIPAGSTIVDAVVEFTIDESSSDPTSLIVAAEAEGQSRTFSEVDSDISRRPLTEATARWTPPPWAPSDDGAKVTRTPGLGSMVQEVIDLPDWTAGNAIAFVITGTGNRIATAFDDDPTAAPVLLVTFEAPSSAQPNVEITGPDESSSTADERAITFTANAVDPEDGDIARDVVWVSDRDGEIGVGASIDAELSVGPHLITASVTDTDAISALDSIRLTIGSVDPVVVAAGDIARCGSDDDEATAEVISSIPDALVLALGDEAYSDGSVEQFAECYDTSWGAFIDRTRPVPGNHDYHTLGAQPYYDYFGDIAGQPQEGWYSYDLGGWHLIALNSNCLEVGGCGRTSPLGFWLAQDLRANVAECILVYSHHPRYSSGTHGSDDAFADMWELLRLSNVDLALSGHDHHYERFAPQDAFGSPDPTGVRQFVVGTGGASLRAIEAQAANSEVADDTSHGVLQLVLRDGSYDWTFLPAEGSLFRDSGTASCNTSAPEHLPPNVEITPPRGSDLSPTVQRSRPITLTATAFADSGDELRADISWSSDLDGPIGNGTTQSTARLTVGEHRIVAQVADAAGVVGAGEITVTVQGPAGEAAQIVESRPAEPTDDAEESLTGEVSLDSSDLELVDDKGLQVVGVRFPGVAVPAGARILRAWVQFTVDEESVDDATLELRAEAIPNGPPFSTVAHDISRRSPTAAVVEWVPDPWVDENESGESQRTPDLAPIIQELVDTTAWTQGNAVVILLTGSGTRTADAFGSTVAALPRLHVEFLLPPA